jgi:hypothetical protein
MKDRECTVGIFANDHACLDVVMAQWALRQLQLQPTEAHRVVTRHDPFLLHAQHLAQQHRIGDRHECALRQFRRPGEAGIVSRDIDVADEPVGLVDVVDPGEP